MTITGRQVAAARALLGWSQDHLSGIAKVTRKTLGTFESGGQITQPKLDLVLEALDREGVRFIASGREIGVLVRASS